jgi:hypothetical protein
VKWVSAALPNRCHSLLHVHVWYLNQEAKCLFTHC